MTPLPNDASFSRTKGFRRIRTLALALVVLGQASLVFGQLPLAESAGDDEPEVSSPRQDLEAERSRVEAHIEEAQTQLAEAKEALQASDGPLSAEDREALDQRITLLQARIQVGRRHQKLFEGAKAIREEKQQLQAELTTWTGLPDPPPYALDRVEEIARKLKSQQAATKTDEARLASFAQGKVLATQQLQASEKAFRQTLEALESAATDAARQEARRQHASSQLSVTLTGEGVAFVRASEQLLTERLGLHRLREELSRRQLAVVLKGLRLTEPEVQGRLDVLAKELETVDADLTRISDAESTAGQQLEDLRQRVEARKQQGDMAPLLNLELQLRLEQLQMIRATLDDINLHIGYLQLQQGLWSSRLNLHQNWDFAKAKGQMEQIAILLEPVEQGISSLEVARAETDAFEVESRFGMPELAVPRDTLIEAVQERRAQLGPTLRTAQQMRDFLGLWKHEIEVRIGDLGAKEQARGWGDLALEQLTRLWSFELLSVEDTLLVDGERIVEKRPVTIGKVIEAILILTVGLLVASGLARLISRIVLPFAADRWQRRLLIQKLLRFAMIALVVVLALTTVKIPLTVFAFLGGAIAIGLGFGAKNLINNFISGFILLGEGTIRPGDRIEIEGTRGIVEKIGERSTRVRRFDGLELLIPNSQFLENSVTNLTLSDPRVRITIQVGVAYGSPTREVQALLLEIARAQELVVADPAPVVAFEDFGDSALIFRLYVWIDLAAQDDYRDVVTELRHTIAERFADKGYEMAFPQMDVHLAAKGPLPVQVLSQSEPTAART